MISGGKCSESEGQISSELMSLCKYHCQFTPGALFPNNKKHSGIKTILAKNHKHR